MRISNALGWALAACLLASLSACASSGQPQPADAEEPQPVLNRASIFVCAVSGAVAQNAASHGPSNGNLAAVVVFMVCQMAGSMQETAAVPPPAMPDRALVEGMDQVRPAAGKAYLAPLTGYRGARVRLQSRDAPGDSQDFGYFAGGVVDTDAVCTYVWGSLDSRYRQHISATLAAGHVYQVQPVITLVPRTGLWHTLMGDMASDYHCKMKLYDATASADVDATITDEPAGD